MHSRVKEEKESCEQKEEEEMLKEKENNSTHYVA